MWDRSRENQQIKLTSQMRNYAKRVFIDECVVLSNKIQDICLMQNESNCSGAHHIKQIIRKNCKAREHRRIFINWIWVRACDPCVTFTGRFTQTALTLRKVGAFLEKQSNLKMLKVAELLGSKHFLSPCCCLSRQFLYWILWIHSLEYKNISELQWVQSGRLFNSKV